MKLRVEYPQMIRLNVMIALCFNSILGAAEKVPGPVFEVFENYCFGCHDSATKKGDFDLEKHLEKDAFNGSLMFENMLTGKMPPAQKDQPDAREKQVILDWLAQRKADHQLNSFRRISRHEFVHSINDLLGTDLDVSNEIPEDRGTNYFDTNRMIKLTQEMLGSYFSLTDEMLDYSLQKEGFPAEGTWVTNKLKVSIDEYDMFHRPYQEGILFSWTRTKNGTAYSFFYDNFEPTVAGWYELTFDAAKIADFEDDMSLQVFGGRFYTADDNPQSQRLLGVISLGNKKLESRSIRAFLHPGENVSVHCYSQHNFQEKKIPRGIYIKQLKARGPIFDQWPPLSYQNIFGSLTVKADPRKLMTGANAKSSVIVRSKITFETQTPENLKRVIKRFAERAFSSKLSEKELEPYYHVGLRRLEKDGNFVEASHVGLKAILCSSRFLMVPGEHANPSYAKAADLARILWLSVPDDELLRLAAKDQLTGDTLRAQIQRMLGDARSQRMIRSFSDQWLNLRLLDKVTPSLKLYPKYDSLLSYYLPLETRMYLHHIIQENLPAGKLIDSDFSFLNQRLARHYGIKGVVGEELRKVSFPPDVPRGGLLTMGSVLKVTTDGFETSPILRGAWISKNIVGTPLSPPPASVPALEPKHGEAKTLKAQIEQHKSNKSCHACHKSIDPYGFALESFDATGQWRDKYQIIQSHQSTFEYREAGFFNWGGVVDSSGEIDEHKFQDISGLKEFLLHGEQKIAYNFAKKFFEYANGYEPDLKQRLEIWNFIGKDPNNLRLKDLITKLLQTPRI